MPTPQSSADYYRRQQRIIVSLLAAVRRTWQRMDPAGRWDEQYQDGIGSQLTMLVTAAQVAATRDADTYIAAVLNELNIGPSTQAGVLNPSGLAGTAGDGRPVESLLALSVVRAGRWYNALQAEGGEAIARQALHSARTRLELAERGLEAATEDELAAAEGDVAQAVAAVAAAREALTGAQPARAADALAKAGRWLELATANVLFDTARAAETAAMTTRPEVTGYVRMLNPPSCSRCVVLAGKWYRWNTGFERHPGNCDCRHIPAAEAMAGDLTVDPDAYFRSLTRAEQDKTFTKAGAQAIRDGADIGQVVNARRGMSTAQINPGGWIPKGRLAPVDIGGRPTYITTESTTRRGLASRSRTGRNMQARLMPESIYQVADDRDDAIRLLRLHGYIH